MKDKKYYNFFDNSIIYDQLVVRTKEGIKIELDFTINIKATIANSKLSITEQLQFIYNNYEDNWKYMLYFKIKNSVFNVCSKYSAEYFHRNRESISKDILIEVNDNLRSIYFHSIDCSIINFTYPTDFQYYINELEIANQKYKTSLYIKENNLIQLDYLKQTAVIKGNINIENKIADNKAMNLQEIYYNIGLNSIYSSMYWSLNNLKLSKLVLNTDNELVNTVFITALVNSNSKNQTINIMNLKSILKI